VGQATQRKIGRLGGAVIAVVVIAAIAGVGLWLGRVDEGSMTPCERYTELVVRELDNCHSGVTRNQADHVAVCEQSVDPSARCFERIEALACDELERLPASAGDDCRKSP
jgi:hypothetical protein